MRSINCLLLLALPGYLWAQEPCAARLSGNWFINCKSLVSYNDQPVVTFSNWSDPLHTVDLDVYSTAHVLQAQVRAGKLTMGSPKRFILKSTSTEFSLVDGNTSRIICILKSVPSTHKDASCQVDVWLDLYVSGAGYFHCDPETSNEPMMQMMTGSTFRGSMSAISLY